MLNYHYQLIIAEEHYADAYNTTAYELIARVTSETPPQHEPGTVLKSVIHNIFLNLPLITTYVSYETETFHLQLDKVRQDIQDYVHD